MDILTDTKNKSEDALKIQDIELPAKGKKLVFDRHKDAPRGFGLKVTPKGKKTFVLRYNAEGKDRLMTIGEFPTWTLTAARKQANDLKREIDGGVDILQQRRVKRAENTVAEIVEQWCGAHADKLTSGPSIRGTLERHLVPECGEMKITEVRRRDFIELIEGMAESTPRQAALLLGHCKRMMAWCEDREIVEYNPIASLKAKNVSSAMGSRIRTRILNADEIAALWNAEELPGVSRATLLALKFILITGQRPGEVCQATKDEVDGNIWLIPKEHRGKTGDEHFVPLTESALELLKQADGEAYLFERYKGRGMDVNALSHAVRGLEVGWRPHDLRRTMRTGLAAAGISETVAELTVGHVRKGIAAVYDQHRYEREKRAAMEAWERRLLSIASGEQDTNVIAFEARA